MNIFNQIPIKRPTRNRFNLSHLRDYTAKMGYLYPSCHIECMPNGTYTVGGDVTVKTSPMLAPIMHRVDVYTHYFFVPYRLLWDGWEDFITNTDPDRQIPTIKLTSSLSDTQKRFLDQFGLPPMTGSNTIDVNAFNMAAYAFIYNEWYRSQDLIPELLYQLQDGDNSLNNTFFNFNKRAFEHDYFTSALPQPQKGAAVAIPVGDIAIRDDWETDGVFPAWVYNNGEQTTAERLNPDLDPPTLPRTANIRDEQNTPVAYDPGGTLHVTATTVNDWRRAIRLQEWFEANARGGTRYIEHIFQHFGQRSSDARLQRPEYITGLKAPIIVQEILNNTGVSETFDGSGLQQTGSPQGTRTGNGISVTQNNKIGKYHAQEHGCIIGLTSIMPKTMYMDGVQNQYLKRDFLDFPFPKFAHLGEQAIKGAEIYADTDVTHQEGTFGYIPRYAEYKYIPSTVSGDFRSSLLFWHLGRKFAGLPALSQQFLEMQDDLINERIWAVTDGTDQFQVSQLNKVLATLPLPVFGVPSI